MTHTPNPIDQLVGKNVRYWRLERGIAVSRVADTLGVDAETVDSMETGDVRISAVELQALCSLLQIGTSALYAGFRPRAAG